MCAKPEPSTTTGTVKKMVGSFTGRVNGTAALRSGQNVEHMIKKTNIEGHPFLKQMQIFVT